MAPECAVGPAPPAAPDQLRLRQKTPRSTVHDADSRRRRVFGAALVSVGAIASLALGGASLIRSATAPPQEAVHAYFAALQDGDLDRARSSLCGFDQRRLGPEQFAASTAGFVGTMRSIETHALDPAGSTRAIAITVRGAGGSKLELAATAVREKGEWKVCSLFG